MAEGDVTEPAGRTAPLSRADLPPSAWAAYDRIAGERGEVPWLFRFLLESPDLAYRVSHVGDYLRAGSSMPDDLREMLILAMSRHLDFQLEWSYHEQMARDAGVDGEVVSALREGESPALPNDEAACRDLAIAAVDGRVTDAVFEAVVERYDARFAVEIVVLAAFVVFMQRLVDALDVPLPDGVPALLPVSAGAASAAP
jgi:4-carboxymuconolactone decarboxylase